MCNKVLSRMLFVLILSFICANTSATNLLFSLSNDNNTVITVNAKSKKKARKYSKQDLYILSHVINGEASSTSYKDKLYVGSVVLNRVKDKRFPNTIKGVVFARLQYACTWDGNYQKTPSKSSVKAAKFLLKHGSSLPKNVVWQGQVRQGRGVYTKVGRHYYCY